MGLTGHLCDQCGEHTAPFRGWLCAQCRKSNRLTKEKTKGKTSKGKASAGFSMYHHFGRE